MAYTQPFIDAAGLHIPTFNEIRSYLLDEARGIFGPDIYLENDGQDYAFISLMSDRIHDTFLAAQLIYNNRGPGTAVGGALDGLVKLNGIKRKRATNSTAVLTVTGAPGTEIIQGFAMDVHNHNWNLDPIVVIPGSGSISVTAVCQEYGPVLAASGEINRIGTPTAGWVGVTNPGAAVPGQTVEGQEELRARQTISTANPSRTVLEGTSGAIAAVLDVTRHRVYENDTDVFGFYGEPIPGHSICAVAEGGSDRDIANAIYLHKTPGCGTYGDVEVEIEKHIDLDIDANIIADMTNEPPIRFFRPVYCDIWITVAVKKMPGYVSQITDQITENVTVYLNSLRIGDDLTLSAVWGSALAAMPDIRRPLFSIVSVTAGLTETEQSAADIAVPFNGVTRGDAARVSVVFSA